MKTTEKIVSFRGTYSFLSNMHRCSVTVGGITYGSAEAAFQAQKTMDMEKRKAFSALSPTAAKKMGRSVELRSDWERVKLTAMLDVVTAKFAQHPKLAEKLLATGDAELVEGNDWGDTFWGVDNKTGVGQNQLGRILKAVRTALRQKTGPVEKPIEGATRSDEKIRKIQEREREEAPRTNFTPSGDRPIASTLNDIEPELSPYEAAEKPFRQVRGEEEVVPEKKQQWDMSIGEHRLIVEHCSPELPERWGISRRTGKEYHFPIRHEMQLLDIDTGERTKVIIALDDLKKLHYWKVNVDALYNGKMSIFFNSKLSIDAKFDIDELEVLRIAHYMRKNPFIAKFDHNTWVDKETGDVRKSAKPSILWYDPDKRVWAF